MQTTWKLLYDSVRGTSHEYRDEPCQDYALGRVVGPAESPVLIVVCADGAGSAAYAKVGARLACLAYLHAASTALEDGRRVPEITDRLVLDWHERARGRLCLEACQCNLPLNDFACTLLTALVGDQEAVFSQIGDGALVIGGANGYEPVFWP